MIKNSITGFVDPKHKYHKLVGIKSDTEFKKNTDFVTSLTMRYYRSF